MHPLSLPLPPTDWLTSLVGTATVSSAHASFHMKSVLPPMLASDWPWQVMSQVGGATLPLPLQAAGAAAIKFA